MARAALGLSTHDLAAIAGVGRMTVVRLEAGNVVDDANRVRIERALESAGARFLLERGRVGVTVPD